MTVLGGAVLIGTVSRARAQTPLRLGLLPSERAPDVIRRAEPFAEALRARLNLPVTIRVATDYSATVEALRFGHVDFAYLGPASFLLLQALAPAVPVARGALGDKDHFHAAIIARPGRVSGLDALRGTEFAFGDVASTSGHVVPRHMLTGAGLHMTRDYSATYLGGHDAVILAVRAGRVLAGGVSEPILRAFEATGRIAPGEIEVVALSGPVPTYPWVAAPAQDPDLIDRMRAALVALPDGPATRAFGADRFVPADLSDFADLRSAMANLGFRV